MTIYVLCALLNLMKFRETDFSMRNKIEYSEDISELPSLLSQGKVHSRGVKRSCLLNDIPGFHVTTNYSLDVMHIVLEGIIPLEIGCILYYADRKSVV